MISCGQVPSLSYSQATGRISFSAKSCAISRMLFCSSVSVKSTTVDLLLDPGAVGLSRVRIPAQRENRLTSQSTAMCQRLPDPESPRKPCTDRCRPRKPRTAHTGSCATLDATCTPRSESSSGSSAGWACSPRSRRSCSAARPGRSTGKDHLLMDSESLASPSPGRRRRCSSATPRSASCSRRATPDGYGAARPPLDVEEELRRLTAAADRRRAARRDPRSRDRAQPSPGPRREAAARRRGRDRARDRRARR